MYVVHAYTRIPVTQHKHIVEYVLFMHLFVLWFWHPPQKHHPPREQKIKVRITYWCANMMRRLKPKNNKKGTHKNAAAHASKIGMLHSLVHCLQGTELWALSFSPPARWGLLKILSELFSSSSSFSSSSFSSTTFASTPMFTSALPTLRQALRQLPHAVGTAGPQLQGSECTGHRWTQKRQQFNKTNQLQWLARHVYKQRFV